MHVFSVAGIDMSRRTDLTLTLVRGLRMCTADPRSYTSDRPSWVTTTIITRGMTATGGFGTTIPGCSNIIRSGWNTGTSTRSMRALTPNAK
jgi:hypothetical protein